MLASTMNPALLGSGDALRLCGRKHKPSPVSVIEVCEEGGGERGEASVGVLKQGEVRDRIVIHVPVVGSMRPGRGDSRADRGGGDNGGVGAD